MFCSILLDLPKHYAHIMARRCVVPAALGGAALFASSQLSQSFVVPRSAETSTQVALHGAQATRSSSYTEAPQQMASVAGAALIATGLAASRRGRVAADRRSDTSRIVCAAGNVGKKRCLVMGGTRFIGCYLVAKLREQGHDVVLCNRGKTNGGKPERLPGVAWATEW